MEVPIEKKRLHYLSLEEERVIKNNIPWESVDPDVRDLVLLANSVEGIATLQSCAGHVTPSGDGFHIRSAYLTFRATEDRTQNILFVLAPEVGITNVSLRFFDDGNFWISLESDPAEKFRLYELFRKMLANAEKS